ncbi:Protein mago nashi [Penicillium rubens]|nr:Protein mago nashi [Penicillium rubens]
MSEPRFPQLLTVSHSSGHSGRFGHEFLEFDLRTISEGSSAAVRYANNSNYRNDSLIRKEMCVSDALVEEVKRIIKDSEILKYALGLPDKKNTGADLI